jgi:tRNA dimethylallyltransferase
VIPLALVGPTATGKSDLSLFLARRFDGEVINADAMQLYRGMDVGTAKLTIPERGGIVHHQLDVLDVTETASVAAYQEQARATMENLIAAGKTPIIVGGSGLYVRALLDDLEFPGTDAVIRDRLLAEVEEVGPEPLYARLLARDPVAAQNILPSNGRRIVRALEVMELTGNLFSATMPKPGPERYGTLQIGLDRLHEELDDRVNLRVELMFAHGLVDEVRALREIGLTEGKTASRALGYQQVLDYLDGKCTEAKAIADTQQATRRFVRRQRSWFRRDKRITWFNAADPDLHAQVVAHVDLHRE